MLPLLSPHVIILIGPPGSGKTSWIIKHRQDQIIISTDNLIEAWASERGLTYSEAWASAPLGDIEKQMKAEYRAALLEDKNIIVDRTNMSKKIRHKLLCHVPTHYKKYAVLFEVDRKELDRRLLLRPGKHISAFVMASMMARYEEPTKEEFDEVFKF